FSHAASVQSEPGSNSSLEFVAMRASPLCFDLEGDPAHRIQMDPAGLHRFNLRCRRANPPVSKDTSLPAGKPARQGLLN
ncbi:MAG: hypothetical protein ACO32J_01975, partial [Phycisphaerales bacterium]